MCALYLAVQVLHRMKLFLYLIPPLMIPSCLFLAIFSYHLCWHFLLILYNLLELKLPKPPLGSFFIGLDANAIQIGLSQQMCRHREASVIELL